MPERLPASFRDPSGFLFEFESQLYRQVNQVYRENYDLLMSSGLYQKLARKGMLISHTEVEMRPVAPDLAYKVIQPQRVEFISYPYEWSFSQLKDAALLTLSIQRQALKAGMTLKDASAYNVQFQRGSPILIDTLSFEAQREGAPWVAYRQFCQHFLAPLALMSLQDIRLSQLGRVYIDGVPLDLAGKLLPWRTRLDFGLLTHIHLHAGAQKRYAAAAVDINTPAASISQAAMTGLLDSLEKTVKKLTWKPGGSEWADYYEATNYSGEAFDAKKRIVIEMLQSVAAPRLVWDLGANTGVFSRLANDLPGCLVVSADLDAAAVETNYLECKQAGRKNILPLVIDLTSPSPAIGWANQERRSLIQRGPADIVMALALLHHLAISNNVPLRQVSQFFAAFARYLIIEFVPKQDSQVERLLASRQDIFPDYTLDGFIAAFAYEFTILQQIPVPGTKRIIFLLERR